MASCSKSMSTAVSVMILVERGQLRLLDRVSFYLPDFQEWRGENGEKKDIRIIDLMTHTSGLPPYAPVSELQEKYGSPNPKGLMEYISTCKREFKPQTKFQYSCLNIITLQHIIEIHYRAKLARLCKRKYLRYTGNAIHGLSAYHTTAGRKVDQYGGLSLDGPDCTYRKTKRRKRTLRASTRSIGTYPERRDLRQCRYLL